jgi:hypothetical protein
MSPPLLGENQMELRHQGLRKMGLPSHHPCLARSSEQVLAEPRL